MSVKDLALGLPSKAWRSVTWREGSQAELTSRFAGVRCCGWGGGPRPDLGAGGSGACPGGQTLVALRMPST